MYKKITHTIVEEHFDCPEAVDISTEVNGSNNYNVPMMGMRPRAASVMPASELQVRLEDYFSTMNFTLHQLADATFSPNIDYELAITSVFDNIEGLGNLLGNYYGVEFRERTNSAMNAIGINLLYLWRNMAIKYDTSGNLERIRTQLIPAMGLSISAYNNNLIRDKIQDEFSGWVESFIDYGVAKTTQNAATLAIAKQNGALAGNVLSTSISTALIKQKPELFTP